MEQATLDNMLIINDLILTAGQRSWQYASQLLKASSAAQPKGCFACFVLVVQKLQINRDFQLSQFVGKREFVTFAEIKTI
jgi:hypothetical protein